MFICKVLFYKDLFGIKKAEREIERGSVVWKFHQKAKHKYCEWQKLITDKPHTILKPDISYTCLIYV